MRSVFRLFLILLLSFLVVEVSVGTVVVKHCPKICCGEEMESMNDTGSCSDCEIVRYDGIQTFFTLDDTEVPPPHIIPSLLSGSIVPSLPSSSYDEKIVANIEPPPKLSNRQLLAMVCSLLI